MRFAVTSPAPHTRRGEAGSQLAVAGPAEPQRTHIAYITSRFPKLTETFVVLELDAMEAAGARVDLYPLLKETETLRHPEAGAWCARAHFQPFLSRPILRENVRCLLQRPRRYLGALAEVLRGTRLSANFFLGAVGIFPKVVLFARLMEQAGVTHVHAHFATHPTIAALIIHRLTGIPYSFTAHGSDLHVDRTMLASKVDSAAFVVAVSRYNKALILRECGRAVGTKVHVIHCGVDPSLFAPAEAAEESAAPGAGSGSGAGSDPMPLQIVCVASFEEVKGHVHLIEACRYLRDRRIPFECELIGRGPLQQRIADLVNRYGLTESVRILGPKPRKEVAQQVRQADVAVLASAPTRRGKREGIPVVLMEAMATGIAVVASDLSGIPELVEHDVDGLLVPPGDPVAIADALARLAEDRALCKRLGRHGRKRIERDFELHKNASLLLDLVRSAADRGVSRFAAHGGET